MILLDLLRAFVLYTAHQYRYSVAKVGQYQHIGEQTEDSAEEGAVLGAAVRLQEEEGSAVEV